MLFYPFLKQRMSPPVTWRWILVLCTAPSRRIVPAARRLGTSPGRTAPVISSAPWPPGPSCDPCTVTWPLEGTHCQICSLNVGTDLYIWEERRFIFKKCNKYPIVHVLILAQPNFNGNKLKLKISTYYRNLEFVHLPDSLLLFIVVKHISVFMNLCTWFSANSANMNSA